MRYGRIGQENQLLVKKKKISSVKGEKPTSILHLEKANKFGVYCVKISGIMVKMCCPSPDVSLKTKKTFNLNNLQYKPIFFPLFLVLGNELQNPRYQTAKAETERDKKGREHLFLFLCF